MNNIFGNMPVSGEDFYGREAFVKELKGILLTRNSFLLLGLRRTGKSSVLKEVLRQIIAEKSDIVIIEINCQTYESIQDFYKNIYLALPQTWKDKLRNAFKKSKRIPIKLIDFITDHIEEIDLAYIGSVKLRNDAISYANTLEAELTAFFRNQQKHIILAIDELPFLFENIALKNQEATKAEIEMVLTTLRSWREIGISEAICGSLNLHLQLESMNISRKLLGGITTKSLPKFTISEAKGLINKLGVTNGLRFNDHQHDQITGLHPDLIPQFLQLFFFYLKMHWDGTTEHIRTVFEKYVYPGIVNDFEYQFDERYARLSNDQQSTIKNILHFIYQHPGSNESEILERVEGDHVYAMLLLLLSQEFLVKNEQQRYDFSFEIVRYWWKKKSF